jgi:hypothetical protein
MFLSRCVTKLEDYFMDYVIMLSPYQWVGESPTPRIGESGSRRLVELLSEYFYKTLWLKELGSRRLPVSVSRRIYDSPTRWVGESLFEIC